MDNREKSVLKTLLYADIFNFPLRRKELWKFLISNKLYSEKKLFQDLLKLKQLITFDKTYIFLKERKKLIKIRERRGKVSKAKLKKADKIIKKISLIPTIKFIGISGALSMRNSEEKDDIDIFVITQNNFVWTTRLLMVLSLMLLGVYRRNNSGNHKDKICLNMILDENNMIFKENSWNLYTAHEIIQLIPLFERDGVYTNFIKANNWYKNFLPNAISAKNNYLKKKTSYYDYIFITFLKIIFIEKILKFIQIRYMQKKITNEIIKNGFLAFHPFNYKDYILANYNKKLKKYKL